MWMKKISAFVEEIRLSNEHDTTLRTPDQSGNKGENVVSGPYMSELDQQRLEEARKKTERTIVEAEKFKEIITEPPGENRNLSFLAGGDDGVVSTLRQLAIPPNPQQQAQPALVGINSGGLTDDDFFHLTCHVDVSLMGKIEKGEFVELEKLLPKEKKHRTGTSDNRLEWVHSGGATFLAPVAD